PAGAVHQPQLPALGALARGHERQVLVVRAPARLRLAVGGGGHLDLLLAGPARHPDVGVVLVAVLDRARHDVGDPLAVRRSLRIADVLHVVDVIDRQRALLRRRHTRYQQYRHQNTCRNLGHSSALPTGVQEDRRSGVLSWSPRPLASCDRSQSRESYLSSSITASSTSSPGLPRSTGSIASGSSTRLSCVRKSSLSGSM